MRAGTFAVDIDRTDPVVVITTSGELDAFAIGRLEPCVETAIRDHSGHVVIDAAGVTFIDSTGITALISVLRRLNRSRRRLGLTMSSGGPLARALQVTGLDHTFECFASVDQAVDTLAGAPLIGR